MRFQKVFGAAAFCAMIMAVGGPAQADGGLEGDWSALGHEGGAVSLERLRRDSLSVRVEDRFSSEDVGDKRGVVVRMRLAPGAPIEPYAGGGFGFDEELFRQDADVMAAGRLVGGVAAPLTGRVQLFGEYQNVRPIAREGAFHRALIGLRRRF